MHWQLADMKMIGIVGGMSWESTLIYYQYLNRKVRDRSGGVHTAKLLLHSVDFAEIQDLQKTGRWNEAGEMLAKIAASLEQGGAEILLLATNTMHKVADQMTSRISIPFLHICDATAKEIVAANCQRVALLGTKFTMEENFYSDKLREYGLTVLTPTEPEQNEIHRIIFEELCLGQVRPESQKILHEILLSLKNSGAQAAILACTELCMLVTNGTSRPLPLPLFDTTRIHCDAALTMANE